MEASDARATLDRLIRERGDNYGAVSKLLGRNPAYIQQFVKRGSPRKLDEADRKLLARYFGVDEALLGAPDDERTPSASVARSSVRLRGDLVAVPRLALGASAGPDSLEEDEAAAGALAFDARWLRALGGRPDMLSLIRVDGESMAPTLNDGDDIMVDRSDGAEIGLALLGLGPEARKLGRVPALRLNEAGDPAADRMFIEYNAPLAALGHEGPVTAALASLIAKRRDWRVLRLSGVPDDCPLVGMIPARRRILADISPAYGVTLDEVRSATGDYLSLLSTNTRSQIRRALKDHGDGTIEVARAGDDAELQAWLAEMHRLNRGRHADNAWDAPLFRAFAQEIARTGLATGAVDVLRITIGGDVTGYLLNFVHGDRAMNYQSAFAEPAGPKDKPGLVTHMAAVAHYAARGLALYSLLAGKDRYKQSLATGAEELHWWQIERFSPVLEAEYWLRRMLRR